MVGKGRYKCVPLFTSDSIQSVAKVVRVRPARMCRCLVGLRYASRREQLRLHARWSYRRGFRHRVRFLICRYSALVEVFTFGIVQHSVHDRSFVQRKRYLIKDRGANGILTIPHTD